MNNNQKSDYLLIVIAVFFLVAAYIPFAAWAQSVKHEINIKSPNAEWIIEFKRLPVYQIHQTERGQVISFDQSLEIDDLDGIHKHLSPWVTSISLSYDALLFQLKPGITLHVTSRNSSMYFNFKVAGFGGRLSESQTTQSSLALDRIDALYLLASGRQKAARLRFRELADRNPDDMPLLLDLARVEENSGNWREAINLYERVELQMPYSQVVKQAKSKLLQEHGDRLSGGVLYNKIGSHSTQLNGTIYGRKWLHNNHVLALTYTSIDADEDADVRRTNGDLLPFNGKRDSLIVTVSGFHQYAQHTMSLFITEKDTGLGWNYQRVNDYGRYGMTLKWKAAWYETAEALAGFGYQNSLAFDYDKNFQQQIALSSSVSVNRYGLDDISNAASSLRLQLMVRYLLAPLYRGFSIGYGLDLEDVTDRSLRTDGNGNDFIPLPLDSREQHVLDIGWQKNLRSHLLIETRLGYEYDRRSESSAPFGHLQLRYQPHKDFEINMNLRTGLASYRGGQDDFYSLGANLIWFY